MNSKDFLMGIDIGTYESKGVIIDSQGLIISYTAISHEVENPKPNYFEHDAEKVWWHDLCILSKKLLKTANLSGKDIRALGVSTLGTCCLPVDREFTPLRKAILYGIDARSQKEIEYLTAYYGDEMVKALFGRPLCSGDVCTKILWLKNNEPEIYNKTAYFLTGASWLVAKLTGQVVLDRFLGIASMRPLYHEDGRIRDDMCGPFCRPDQLPKGRAVTDIAGNITKKAAEETGLSVDTPVTIGTGDSAAEAISTGVLSPGDLMLQFGSSVFLYCCTDRQIEDSRIRSNTFLIPGTFSIAAGTNNCGTLTRWYRDQLFPESLATERAQSINAYELMMAGLEQIPPGSDGLITLPYFSGERTPINDPNAKGVIFGLELHHTKQHLYRSALEGIAYSVGQHIDILEENKVTINKIMAVGGGTKNPLWMQIVADVIGKPVNTAAITIGASYGDCLIAGIGCRIFPDFHYLRNIIRPRHTYEPGSKNHKVYAHYRKFYDQLYLINKETMHRLASLRK